jgi:hypothetical protein
MSRAHVTTKAVAFSLLFPLLLAFPTLTPTSSPSLFPRADDECFATAFGITDFRSFDGSDTQPASVSFKAASDHFEGQVLCSRSGASGSTSPYFLPAVPCNRTGLPNIFFSYPEDRVLRVYQVTPCGTAG